MAISSKARMHFPSELAIVLLWIYHEETLPRPGNKGIHKVFTYSLRHNLQQQTLEITHKSESRDWLYKYGKSTQWNTMKLEQRMSKLFIDAIDGHRLSEKIKGQKIYIACNFFSKQEEK